MTAVPRRSRPRGELPTRKASPFQGGELETDWDFKAVVLGVPYPEGSKVQGWGKSVKDASPKTKEWRGIIKSVCEPLVTEPLDGSLEVEVSFTYAPPKSWDGVTPPTTKTTYDIDKLLRSCFDGLTDAGVWVDDARCTKETAEQFFVGMPGALEEPGMVVAVRRRSHQR